MLYADASETPTIDLMIDRITKLPQFSGLQKWLYCHDNSSAATRMRNFASFIAHEETIIVSWILVANDSKESPDGSGGMPDQKVLCVTKRGEFCGRSTGDWTACLSQSPGFRKSAIAQTQ